MALLALAPMRRPKLLMHGGASRRALEGSLCRYPSAPLLVHVDVVRSQTWLALGGHYRKHASAERERGGGTTCISLVAGRQGRVWPRRSTSQSNASFMRDTFNVVGTPGRTRMAEGEHLVVMPVLFCRHFSRLPRASEPLPLRLVRVQRTMLRPSHHRRESSLKGVGGLGWGASRSLLLSLRVYESLVAMLWCWGAWNAGEER